MSKTELVLRHMKDHNGITCKDAVDFYGAYRLSSIIKNLRDRGEHIVSVPEEGYDRLGNKVRWVRYIWKEE